MSRICPETGEKVVYLTCQECDEKLVCFSKSRQQIARELKIQTSFKENTTDDWEKNFNS